MRIADTSLLYALFSKDDVHHKEATERCKIPDPILIPAEIWSETISLIHYRQGYDMAVEAGGSLLDLPHVELISSRMEIVRSAWKIYKSTGGNLSIPDCVVLTSCDDRNASPLTFDEGISEYYSKKIE